MAARRVVILSLVTIAFLLPWAAVAHADEATVRITNFTFDPPSLKVKTGTVVTWTNEDDIPHTVAATKRAFKSSALDDGERYSFTFSTPGSYEYFCSLHPRMKATIVVERQWAKSDRVAASSNGVPHAAARARGKGK